MIAPAPDREADEDDAEVVGIVLAGDTEAFRILVERYEARVLRFVRSLAPPSAMHEDIAQEVFLSAFLALPTFDGARGHFAAWLFVIAKNRCFNVKKKMSPLLLSELPILVAPRTPIDELAYAETTRRLDAALDALPEDQKSCFVLEEIVGLSAEQVAEIEGVAVGTIRSRLSRAKARLRQALAPAGGQEA
jgi:RNA polymerase sigma-70 factor, ECF subfamily